MVLPRGGSITPAASGTSDGTTTEPRPLRPRPAPRYAVLVALSLCHLLNDTIQSLLPAIYPVLQAELRAELHPDRLPALRLPGDRLAAAAGGRPLHRPAADVPARRPPAWARACSASLMLAFAHALLGCCSSPRWRSASARRSSTRTRRGSPAPPRAAATASPSRCSRSAATPAPRSGRCSPPSSCCRSASRASPGSRCWRSSAMVAALERRQLGARPAPAPQRGRAAPPAPALAAAAPAGDRDHRRARAAGLLEVHLRRQPDELLHLLPDRALRRLGADTRSSCSSSSSARSPPAPSSAARSATGSGARR